MDLPVNQFERVFQFKIVLRGIDPLIWRRIHVPENYSFEDLSAAIQDVMDWIVTAGSSYSFEIKNPKTGLSETIGNPNVGLSEYLRIKKPMFSLTDYFSKDNHKAIYTFSDDNQWDFDIELEEILPADKYEVYPVCVAGKRAAPPVAFQNAAEYRKMLAEFEAFRKRGLNDLPERLAEYFDDDFDPELFEPDNILFTASSGNPSLPEDFLEQLTAAFNKLKDR